MKQTYQLALCVFLGSCLAAGQTAVPQAPSEDFRDVVEAVRAAPSWHVAGTRPILVNGEPAGLQPIEMAAACPDRELITTGEGSGQTRFLVLERGAWSSAGDSTEAAWKKMDMTPQGGRPPCGRDALAGRIMRPETARSAGITVLRGTLCRLWQLAFYDESDGEIEGTLCAGPDNLPLEVGYSDGLRLTFIDWGHTEIALHWSRTRFGDLILWSDNGLPFPAAKAR
ncbi:MAG TPA: hypothetical protein VLT85_10035 [Terriglobales bacterium]|nr:hypothetical protein [Terriglobales bacterium]